MKGKKFRYDEKKLGRSSVLKKQIALYLAQDFINKQEEKIPLAEIYAYGLKIRPFVAYSDKELIKQFDALYASKHEYLQKALEEKHKLESYAHSTWRLEETIKKLESDIKNMQPYIDELIEEAFGE
jgi:hypothetical protein